MGHVISSNGVAVDQAKVKSFKSGQDPQILLMEEIFWGSAPITDDSSSLLTKWPVPFMHFPINYNHSTGQTKLRKPSTTQESTNWSSNFRVSLWPWGYLQIILDTDASDHRISAVPSQLLAGQERVRAYFSQVLKKLNDTIALLRKSFLQLWSQFNTYRYLYGQSLTVKTDHAALRWILHFK